MRYADDCVSLAVPPTREEPAPSAIPSITLEKVATTYVTITKKRIETRKADIGLK